MKVLFVDDCNAHEGADPHCTLVKFNFSIEHSTLKYWEYQQIGVGRRGGDWKELCNSVMKMGITWELIKQARWSEIVREFIYEKEYVMIYYMVSGNY